MRKASVNTSAAPLAPNTRATTISRAMPSRRLTMVSPPMEPSAAYKFMPLFWPATASGGVPARPGPAAVGV